MTDRLAGAITVSSVGNATYFDLTGACRCRPNAERIALARAVVRRGCVAANSKGWGAPSLITTARSQPTASNTATMAWTMRSVNRPSSEAIPSDAPVPRGSNQMWRPKVDNRPKKRTSRCSYPIMSMGKWSDRATEDVDRTMANHLVGNVSSVARLGKLRFRCVGHLQHSVVSVQLDARSRCRNRSVMR